MYVWNMLALVFLLASALLVVGLVVLQAFALHGLRRRIRAIEKRLISQPNQITPASIEGSIASLDPPSAKQSKAEQFSAKSTTVRPPTRQSLEPSPKNKTDLDPVPKPEPARRTEPSQWQLLEQQLIKNWTGLLGVLAIVAGVSFVAISAVTVMQPFQRFLMLEAVCIALVLPSLLLGNESRFRQLSLWLRSGAGALHLFAAAAAITWPALGLEWVSSIWVAIALIGSAISLNLLLAAIAPSAWIAATHVLISLVPIAVAAPSTETSALIGIITIIGLLSPAGAQAPTRALITTSFLLSQLWIIGGEGGANNLSAIDGGLASLIACAIAGFELWGLHWRPPSTLRKADNWLRWSAGIAWLTVLLLMQSPSWSGIGLLLAAISACALSLMRRLPVGKNLEQVDWTAALILTITAIARLVQPLNQSLLHTEVLIVICAGFLLDALRRRNGGMIRLGAGALWLFDTVALVKLGSTTASWDGSVADLLLLAGVGIGQQWMIRRCQGKPSCQWISSGLAIAGLVLPTMAVLILAPLAIQGWSLTILMLISLGLAQWPEPIPRHRQPVVGMIWLIWLVLANSSYSSFGPHWGFVSEALTLTITGTIQDLTERVLPMLVIAVGLTIASDRLDKNLFQVRTSGLIMSGVSLVIGGWGLREVMELPRIGLGSLSWLLLLGGLIALALALVRQKFRGEVDVLLAMGCTSLFCFEISRLSTQAADPALAFLVDSAAVLLLILLRLGGQDNALMARPLWRQTRQLSGDLAVGALMVSLTIRMTPELRVIVPAALALIAWRLPTRSSWPRQKVHGVLMFWLSLLGLVALPSAGIASQVVTLSLPLIAACNFPNQREGKLLEQDSNPESIPALVSWMPPLGRIVSRQPQRFLAFPLSLAIVLVALQGVHEGAWLTLIWSAEALALYIFSIVYRDRPLRLSALALLALCLLRLVGWDMQQADLGLRGLVFTGVGLVMLTMNVLTTRFER